MTTTAHNILIQLSIENKPMSSWFCDVRSTATLATILCKSPMDAYVDQPKGEGNELPAFY